uniref:Uncharacterized protein n=1 Tax=Hyaloperonospora arabidopsidis (strain Emoy2) TaxID=559515 RepID=M4B5H7_HYAAE
MATTARESGIHVTDVSTTVGRLHVVMLRLFGSGYTSGRGRRHVRLIGGGGSCPLACGRWIWTPFQRWWWTVQRHEWCGHEERYRRCNWRTSWSASPTAWLLTATSSNDGRASGAGSRVTT